MGQLASHFLPATGSMLHAGGHLRVRSWGVQTLPTTGQPLKGLSSGGGHRCSLQGVIPMLSSEKTARGKLILREKLKAQGYEVKVKSGETGECSVKMSQSLSAVQEEPQSFRFEQERWPFLFGRGISQSGLLGALRYSYKSNLYRGCPAFPLLNSGLCEVLATRTWEIPPWPCLLAPRRREIPTRDTIL